MKCLKKFFIYILLPELTKHFLRKDGRRFLRYIKNAILFCRDKFVFEECGLNYNFRFVYTFTHINLFTHFCPCHHCPQFNCPHGNKMLSKTTMKQNIYEVSHASVLSVCVSVYRYMCVWIYGCVCLDVWASVCVFLSVSGVVKKLCTSEVCCVYRPWLNFCKGDNLSLNDFICLQY